MTTNRGASSRVDIYRLPSYTATFRVEEEVEAVAQVAVVAVVEAGEQGVEVEAEEEAGERVLRHRGLLLRC